MNAFVLGALPLLVGASFFLVRWILSPYSIFKYREQQLIVERDNLKKHLDAISDIKSQDRMRKRQSMYESCAKMLKEAKTAMLSFHAIAHNEAYKLEEPEDLDWLCNELAKHHGNPFEGMDSYVPHSDRKEFLRWVCLHPFYDPKSGMAFLQAAEAWREEHHYPKPPDNDLYAHDASIVAGMVIKPNPPFEN
jgi:hypothetical protein